MKKSLFALVFILPLVIDASEQIGDDCRLNLSWGHGGAGNVYERHAKLKVKGRSIFQGCGVGGSGSIDYQVWQTGYNGDWMGEASLIDNGGFNPVMSLKSRSTLDKYSKVNDKKSLKSAEKIYVQTEKEWAHVLAGHAKVDEDELIDGVISVGYARLTQYHWASLVKEADKLIKNKTCSKVSINFICHDEKYSYVNDMGVTIDEADLDDQVYSDRIMQAEFKHMSVDHALLVDSSGNNIVFKNKACLNSPTVQIDTVPRKCGESHVVDAGTIEQYKAGECGEFLNKVTTQYKRTRKLAGRADIFSPERAPADSDSQSTHSLSE